MTVRILITDDHGVVRQGLRMFLSLDPHLRWSVRPKTARRL